MMMRTSLSPAHYPNGFNSLTPVRLPPLFGGKPRFAIARQGLQTWRTRSRGCGALAGIEGCLLPRGDPVGRVTSTISGATPGTDDGFLFWVGASWFERRQ